jgi:transcriptional regulator with XRE-family HTH domain
MRPRVQEVQKAIELRKKGYSYKDIMAEVTLSKSTLSNYLKDLPLTEDEKKYLKSRTDGNISRGRIKASSANHMRRVVRDGFLFKEAREEFIRLSKEKFFHIGIALYWAEGAKRNTSFAFINSDVEMISMMASWIEQFLLVPRKDIYARLYTHKPFASENSEEYWAQVSGIPIKNFKKTIYKPTGKLVKKRPNYRGCLRIELGKVVYLRKLIYWQKMLVEYYKKQGYSTSGPS